MTRRIRGAIGRYDALLLVSLLWFLAKLVRYAFPPLFETLGVEYGVSTAALGTAFTAFMLVYAAAQFPSGVLADRIGPVVVLAGGGALAAVGALAVVVAGPFLALVGAMIVLGLGTGVHKTVAIGLLTRVYRARSGRALGVHDTVGTFGGVLAPAIVAVLLQTGAADWRVLFLLSSGVVLLAVAGLVLRAPRRVREADEAHSAADLDRGIENHDSVGDEAARPETVATDHEGQPLRAYAAPFADRRFLAFVGVTLGFGFAYNGLVAFLPLYLVGEAEVTSATASGLYGLFFLVSVVQLVTGELSDRVGRLPVVTGSIGLATAAFAGLVVAPGLGPIVAGAPIGTTAIVVALGLGTHGFRPVRAAHLESLLPQALAGGGLGAVRTALMGVGALAPAAVGVLAEAVGFRAAFGLLLATLGVALVLAAGLSIRQP